MAAKLFKKKLTWIAILALLAVTVIAAIGQQRVSLGPEQGRSFNYAPAGDAVRATLRVGTYNIDGGQKSDLEHIANNLEDLDVIGLNEVHGSLIGTPSTQAQWLGERLKMPYLFAPTERRWWHNHFGNAVLCDLPIDSWRREPLQTPQVDAMRNMAIVTARWNGRQLSILVTHVDWKPTGAAQRKEIADAFLALPSPAILMGDLNANIDDAAIKSLLAQPEVVDVIAKISPAKHIDWILVRGLDVVDAGVIDNDASDHPAYWAELKWPK